jgi:hypothetical protein
MTSSALAKLSSHRRPEHVVSTGRAQNGAGDTAPSPSAKDFFAYSASHQRARHLARFLEAYQAKKQLPRLQLRL